MENQTTWEGPRLALHTIRQGDNLYDLAKEYHTTVEAIQALNPQIEVYNLQIGTSILLMPGSNSVTITIPNEVKDTQNADVERTGPLTQNQFINNEALSFNNNPPKTFTDSNYEDFRSIQQHNDTPANLSNAHIQQTLTAPMQRQMQNNTNRPSPFNIQRNNKNNINTRMRFLWTQNVYWTRMLIISIVERLKDQDTVAKRLMENSIDIGSFYVATAGQDTARTINSLLNEQTHLCSDLVISLRDRHQDIDNIRRRFYANAEKLADAFSITSSSYDRVTLKRIFLRHVDATVQQINMRIMSNHRGDIMAFGEIEKETMELADYLSNGI